MGVALLLDVFWHCQHDPGGSIPPWSALFVLALRSTFATRRSLSTARIRNMEPWSHTGCSHVLGCPPGSHNSWCLYYPSQSWLGFMTLLYRIPTWLQPQAPGSELSDIFRQLGLSISVTSSGSELRQPLWNFACWNTYKLHSHLGDYHSSCAEICKSQLWGYTLVHILNILK